MGCGSSQVNPGEVKTDQAPVINPGEKEKTGAIQNGNLEPKKSIPSKTDSNANRADSVTNNPGEYPAFSSLPVLAFLSLPQCFQKTPSLGSQKHLIVCFGVNECEVKGYNPFPNNTF